MSWRWGKGTWVSRPVRVLSLESALVSIGPPILGVTYDNRLNQVTYDMCDARLYLWHKYDTAEIFHPSISKEWCIGAYSIYLGFIPAEILVKFDHQYDGNRFRYDLSSKNPTTKLSLGNELKPTGVIDKDR